MDVCTRTAKMVYTLVLTMLYAHKVRNPLKGTAASLSLGDPSEGGALPLPVLVIAGRADRVLFGWSGDNDIRLLWCPIFTV